MDNYRRPRQSKAPASNMLEGFIPAKTKNADPKTQPYRHAVTTTQTRRTKAVTPQKRVAPIDMSLPAGESFNRHHMTPRIRRQIRTARTWALRGAIASLVLLIGVGGLLVSQGFLNINKVFKGTAESAASLQENVDPSLLKGEGDGRINVLLVGVGGEGHAGGNLTDTLLLASIDPVNNTASLLSVPRDLWVTLPGKGSMKINASYVTGIQSYAKKNREKDTSSQAVSAGFTSVNQTIERVLGVPIHYNLLVNFQAFRQAVDTVGGVNIAVPEDLYDPSMAWENNRNPYLAKAGNQKMDGKQALMYVRSRHTSSDFARSERQKALLLALKEKAVSVGVLANPTKIAGLLGTFGNNVQTDLSLGDASRLYSVFKKIPDAKIASVSLTGATTTTSSSAGTDSLVTTGNVNGQSIVMPKAGLENYAAIQEFVRGSLKDGYILKEKARVLVLNGTVEDGLAETTAKRLRSYGYNVVGIARAPSTAYPSTGVVDLSKGKKKYTKRYLEQRFHTAAVSKLPDSTITPGTADFVVILGGDETGNN